MTDSPVDKYLGIKKHGFPSQANGKKSFVVVVDAQVDFMRKNGALYVPDAELIGPKINRFLSALSPNDCCGVLFTFDTHYVDEYPLSEEALQFPPHCLYSTPGWALDCDYQSIAKDIPKHMLTKGYFDMWKDEGREKDVLSYPMSRTYVPVKQNDFFAKLKKEVEAVIVIGVASDICVKYAIKGFLERGFHVITDHNLCAHIEIPIADVCEELCMEQLEAKTDAMSTESALSPVTTTPIEIKSLSKPLIEIYDLMPRTHTFLPNNGWFKVTQHPSSSPLPCNSSSI